MPSKVLFVFSLSAFLFIVTLNFFPHRYASAFTIGDKGRVSGPQIHTTYYLTTNNGLNLVHATAYMGEFINGNCVYNAIYNIGDDMLKTGDFVDIDGNKLKSIVGGGYSCMSIYYYYKQIVIDTFRLIFDGINYTASIPETDEVTIL